eukprot:gene10786-biopygen22840
MPSHLYLVLRRVSVQAKLGQKWYPLSHLYAWKRYKLWSARAMWQTGLGQGPVPALHGEDGVQHVLLVEEIHVEQAHVAGTEAEVGGYSSECPPPPGVPWWSGLDHPRSTPNRPGLGGLRHNKLCRGRKGGLERGKGKEKQAEAQAAAHARARAQRRPACARRGASERARARAS